MKVSAISLSNYQKSGSINKVSHHNNKNTVFKNKHFCRNIGLGGSSLVNLAGIGLWTLATGGVPVLIGGLMAVGTAAAGVIGDAIDKSIEEDEKDSKK